MLLLLYDAPSWRHPPYIGSIESSFVLGEVKSSHRLLIPRGQGPTVGTQGGLWGAADVRPLPLLWGAGEPCLLAADAKPHVESSRHKSVFFFYWNVDFLLSPL